MPAPRRNAETRMFEAADPPSPTATVFVHRVDGYLEGVSIVPRTSTGSPPGSFEMFAPLGKAGASGT